MRFLLYIIIPFVQEFEVYLYALIISERASESVNSLNKIMVLLALNLYVLFLKTLRHRNLKC